jgi:hypothetical protein
MLSYNALPDLIGTCKLASGAVSGVIPILKFAFNPEISINDEMDIWSYTGGDLEELSAAETMEVVSSSATDTMLVVLTGVDNDYELIQEAVTLTGTTAATTAQSFLAVWRVEVSDTASSVNAGDITVTASASGTVQAFVDAENGQTEMSHLTIPAGYTGFLFNVAATTSQDGGSIIRILTRLENGPYKAKSVFEIPGTTFTQSFRDFPFPYPEKTRTKVVGLASSNNTRVSLDYQMVLIKNTLLI